MPKSVELQELYGMLREHRVLEDMQGILSPFRLPEELVIKTTECGMVNSWYSRENSKPTVTICYELLRHISQSLPKKTTPDGITPRDAAIGQFFWLTTHEVGHAMFDLFKVPLFGHAEDAADNFAGYISAIRQGASAEIDRGRRLGVEGVRRRLQNESHRADAASGLCQQPRSA